MAKEILNLEVKSNIKTVTADTDKMADSLEDVNKEAKDSIGNFTLMGVSLNGVKAAFGKIIPMAKAMFGTIKAGMISTGIGALIVAFGVLMAWFTKTKIGAEALSKIFTGIGAAVDVIVDRVTGFASAVGKLFSGNIKGGLRDLTGTFKGMGDEMSREIRLAVELKGKLQTLTDAERELNVEFAQRRAEIEELKMISEDLTKTEEERLRATKKAFKIENDLLDKNIILKETAVEIQREQNELGESMAEDLDALADKEITLANIRGESATKQIELNNKINSIEREAEAKRKAEADERKTRNAEAHAEKIAQIEAEEKAELERIAEVKKAQEDAEVLRADGFAERFKFFDDLRDENYLNELSDLQFQEEEKLRIEREAQETSISYLATDKEERFLLDEQYRIKKEALDKKAADIAIAQAKAVADAKAAIRDANISNIEGGIALVKSLAGENKEIQAAAIIAENAVGIAKTIISTQTANIGALASPANILVPGSAAPIIAANNIAAGIAIASSVAAAAQGLSALGKGGATGGSNPNTPSPSESSPAPQMMSGAFELTGGQEVEPARAYVVSDDITDSQNGLAIIRRRATI